MTEPGRLDPAEVVAEQVHDHRVLRAVLRGGEQPVGGGAILLRPSSARRRSLHRPGHDRAAAALEEQLGRGGEHAVPAEVEVGRERPPLRVAEVAVQASRVALHPGAQAHRVVDLVGLARRDQLVDPLDGRLEPLAGSGGRPRAVGRRRNPVVAGQRQGGLLRALEHREPRERECGERVLGIPRPDHEGGVEAGRGLVAHEPGDPQAAPGRRLRRVEHGDDLTGARGLQHADRFHQPERRRGAGEVVEPRLEHARHDTGRHERFLFTERRVRLRPLRGR